ncbi:MAG TPA: GNAT family N-acetyltransferase [Gemmatimonadaceae bacterium]|jgi:GNAT superfamily N-acetyltransferase
MNADLINIRKAVPTDAGAIADVHVASWRATYAGLVAQSYLDGLSVAERTAAWERRLGNDAQLHAIYLTSAVQRSGTGRKLVGAWAAVAVDRGLTAAVVQVLARNPSRGFYEHLGARHLEDIEVVIGGERYTEACYGWADLRALATLCKHGSIRPRT